MDELRKELEKKHHIRALPVVATFEEQRDYYRRLSDVLIDELSAIRIRFAEKDAEMLEKIRDALEKSRCPFCGCFKNTHHSAADCPLVKEQ